MCYCLVYVSKIDTLLLHVYTVALSRFSKMVNSMTSELSLENIYHISLDKLHVDIK